MAVVSHPDEISEGVCVFVSLNEMCVFMHAYLYVLLASH